MKSNKNWDKWAKYVMIGLVVVVLTLFVGIPAIEIILGYTGILLFDYIEKHPLGVLIVACIAGMFSYFIYNSSNTSDPIPDKAQEKPSERDYFVILETIRLAVAEVAQALGLAPIDSHTDMAANRAERILSWGKVWGFKYKALKLSSTATIDVEQACRIIQAQVETVLDRDNPSKLTEINTFCLGCFESVIQIAEVKDDDAYIYIYVVMASDTYFKQKEAENRASTLHTEADTSDTDF